MNIYERIKQDKGYITALAPMEDVTDTVFRQMLCDIGRPDLFFTEFMNVDGFCSEGRNAVKHRLRFVEKEKPLVIQLWGMNPSNYVDTVKYVKGLNPDGIDINMGCSVKNVLSHGAGSGLIQSPTLAKEIIDVVKKTSNGIPVSVKTRIGYDSVITEDWIGFLLEQNLSAITVHGRISKEGYNIPSRWDEVGKVVDMRNDISPNTMIIGNGDITSFDQGVEYVKKYSVDGFMVGRGIMSNPWLFAKRDDISKEERLRILLNHINLFERNWDGIKPFHIQKKYIKMYVSGFDGANDIRKDLMVLDSCNEVREYLERYL